MACCVSAGLGILIIIASRSDIIFYCCYSENSEWTNNIKRIEVKKENNIHKILFQTIVSLLLIIENVSKNIVMYGRE